MKAWTIRISLVVAALMAVCVADVARAQAPLEPAQMSPRTLFYLIWRGVPSPDARKANALLALWDDADFAPVRSAMVAGMLGSWTKSPRSPNSRRSKCRNSRGYWRIRSRWDIGASRQGEIFRMGQR